MNRFELGSARAQNYVKSCGVMGSERMMNLRTKSESNRSTDILKEKPSLEKQV